MTDQELQQLAREYAEQNPPQIEDEALRKYGMYLNASEVFEPFLYWLTKTHCIISKESIRQRYTKCAEAQKLLDMQGSPDTGPYAEMCYLHSLFGKELFTQKGE